jgi:hypothetical protein
MVAKVTAFAIDSTVFCGGGRGVGVFLPREDILSYNHISLILKRVLRSLQPVCRCALRVPAELFVSRTLQQVTVLAGCFAFPRSFPNLLPVTVEFRRPWKTGGRFCSPPALEMGSNK